MVAAGIQPDVDTSNMLIAGHFSVAEKKKVIEWMVAAVYNLMLIRGTCWMPLE
jgi:hypothetical protein